MSDLRAKVIRLAHQKPELRAALLPLLKTAAVNPFVRAYFDTALFSSYDENGRGMLSENYGFDDIDTATVHEMERDCEKFLRDNAKFLGDKLKEAGSAFWISRNDYLNGFDDSRWGEFSNQLEKAAAHFGGYILSVDSHGEIHGQKD